MKRPLNLLEHPPAEYERAVVLISSSEGAMRGRVGRHSWARVLAMWNMPLDGFAQLYEQLPGPQTPLDEVWAWTGGPPLPGELYRAGWDVDVTVEGMIVGRGLRTLVSGLSEAEVEILGDAVEDPDTILKRYREAEKLARKLADKNLLIEVWDREPYLWLDVPPPERDPDLGIGRHYAWQTPLHREAVRRALGTPHG